MSNGQGVEGFVDGRRGRHIVFLGYAAGVGKTYAMLQDGIRGAHLGEDVVIGVLQDHARPETGALASDLERLAPRTAEYHGVQLEELDLDAALLRRPDWLLVDELAHTNVPGSVQEKRWESVEVLLEAGINVMSTLNVQHLDSLIGFVFRATGAWVHETVPDRVLDDADEIVFIDIPAADLIARLKDGGVCGSDELGSALTHFFRANCLAALRSESLEFLRRHDGRVRVCSGGCASGRAHRLLDRLREARQQRFGT
jgi:two-component system sensor histidine kinase KdpD